ncbi:MAG: HPr(Ser) kinase/phosphatase [Candidatus Lernaella stagnicola]|nr:HPr(Ser) kinase/phosphatase [Candidatus Lernaella stagnicola]
MTVNELLLHRQIDLALELVAGRSGLENKIRTPYIQKSGLAMTGYVAYVARNRVQVFGQTEISFLVTLSEEEQERVCKKFFDQRVACCVVTRNLQLPEVFIQHAERTQTPVLRSQLPTQALIDRVTKLLETRFAKSASMHGVLLDVFGVGVLLLGESGIGKSECALDLVTRGHRLVADDSVDLVRQGPMAIYGRGPDVIKYHMEVRGLGIINIKDLFGISAIRDRKRVQLVVKLVPWEKNVDYDRIGLDDKAFTIIGVELPLIVLPVRPGRNLSTIVEVAARNQLLKLEGYHSAKEFQQHLLSTLSAEADVIVEETE